ncbi:MAG: MOFRL family protein, partial [Campylobacterota bacterium]|nr:MOFRL family protein [Campylobacterota bacterium]
DILKHSEEECIIFGGECTVNVTGNGKGGRNQHAVLLMLKKICEENRDICFLSAGTDGIDGNSNAAGAVVDKQSCKKAKDLGLSIDKYLKAFDSHNFFKEIDDLVVTGVSGTNVIDLAIILQTDKFKG